MSFVCKMILVLAEYLRFYNPRRVHWAFGDKLTPPAVMVASSYYLNKLPVVGRNGWTYSEDRQILCNSLCWF